MSRVVEAGPSSPFTRWMNCVNRFAVLAAERIGWLTFVDKNIVDLYKEDTRRRNRTVVEGNVIPRAGRDP